MPVMKKATAKYIKLWPRNQGTHDNKRATELKTRVHFLPILSARIPVGTSNRRLPARRIDSRLRTCVNVSPNLRKKIVWIGMAKYSSEKNLPPINFLRSLLIIFKVSI